MRITSYSKGLNKFLGEVKSSILLSAKEERRLFRKYRKTGDRQAQELLVRSVLRTVVFCAHKFRGFGFPLEELISCGNVGVLEALKRFDLKKKTRFNTFAIFWVRAELFRFIYDNHSIVHLDSGPVTTKIFYRVRREEARAHAEFGEDVDDLDELLARRMQLRASHAGIVKRVRNHLAGDASLDTPVYDDDDGKVTFLDCFAADHMPTDDVDDEDMSQRRRELIEQAIFSLSPRERMIINARYLQDNQTLAEIGRTFNLSRERIRQLETIILDKLRHRLLDLTRKEPELRVA